MDVAVVGGGPAGLAAAWELRRSGARVCVYERRDAPGGRLRTDVLDGVRVDPAVQLLGAYYRETFRLAGETGAADVLVRSPGRDALWRRGRAHPITYGSVSSMAASGALPTGLKLRLASRYVGFLRRHAGVLDVNDPARSVEAGLDDESIAAWAHREMGDDFVELLAYPLLGAYYGSAPEETSAGFYHGLARAGMDVEVYGVRGGMGALARRIADALEASGALVRPGVEVRAVEPAADGVRVAWDGGTARHDAAVLAVPAPVIPGLARWSGELDAWLAGVRTAPTVSLALLLDRPAPADFFGLSFPRTTTPGERVVACCVEDRKLHGLVPRDRGLIVAFPAPARAGELADAAPDAVLDTLLPALTTAFPGLERWVRRAKVYRFPEGYAVFYPGYLRHLRRFDPGWLPDRIALAGDFLVAPTVEGAVRSGRRAAERLLALRR